MAVDIPAQAGNWPGQAENGDDGDGANGVPPGPAAPKKIKKQGLMLQDTRTELRDDELIASRNNYLKVRLISVDRRAATQGGSVFRSNRK